MSNTYLTNENERLRDKVWVFRTCRIVSAFFNPLDHTKLQEYESIFSELGCYHEFPPILGYPGVIGDREIDGGLSFLDDTEITEAHRGEA